MKNKVLLLPLFLFLMTSCNNTNNNEVQKDLRLGIVFSEGYYNSKTIVKINNNIILDTILSSELIAPNTGSSHWAAGETSIHVKTGIYKLNISIDSVNKDTSLTLNDSLYMMISKDSTKIRIRTQDHYFIYM